MTATTKNQFEPFNPKPYKPYNYKPNMGSSLHAVTTKSFYISQVPTTVRCSLTAHNGSATKNIVEFLVTLIRS